MGHNDSKGGGGHGSPPLEDSGQLGRAGSRQPSEVDLGVSGEEWSGRGRREEGEGRRG